MTGVVQIPMEIVIVDDEPEFRDTVARRLARRGYSVAGEPTTVNLTGSKCDLVIVRHSPASYAALDSLSTSGIRQVIVICGREVVETAVEALPRCATDLMIKPLIWPELDWRVQRAAERVVALRNAGVGQNGERSARLDPGSVQQSFPNPSTSGSSLFTADALAAVQRAHILEILRREGGNKARTARALGVNRRSLYRLIEKFQIQMSESSVGNPVSAAASH